jgi:hypothetical protein
MAFHARVAILAILGLAPAATVFADEAFRCGNRLIEPGMTIGEVRQLCGPPTKQVDEVQDVRSGNRVVGKTTFHRWTYESYSQTRVLVFDQDTLKSIEDE